ncbi:MULTISPECIES: hypothetical protein [Pseudomonas]|uniref:hypothetical protein n=1 Tax=Pseudomonas TaxID=286 RepID=UPI001F3B257A|nr:MULTISPECIES: hypothetical protein [Pseudomonas]WHS57636.1 hypothetical protein QLH64_30245 [Pseudomonas brassicacearum]
MIDAPNLEEHFMPVVMIDGVEYVPKAEIHPLDDERLTQAIAQLVSIQYFDQSSKAIAHAWEVLRTLAPEVAELVASDPSAAYRRFHPTS